MDDLYNFGSTLYNNPHYGFSIVVFDILLNYLVPCDGTENEKLICSCYGGLGLSHQYVGNFQKVTWDHIKALTIKKRMGDEKGESVCYSNIYG